MILTQHLFREGGLDHGDDALRPPLCSANPRADVAWRPDRNTGSVASLNNKKCTNVTGFQFKADINRTNV